MRLCQENPGSYIRRSECVSMLEKTEPIQAWQVLQTKLLELQHSLYCGIVPQRGHVFPAETEDFRRVLQVL